MRALRDSVISQGAQFALLVVPSKHRLYGGSFDPSLPEFAEQWRRRASTNSVTFLDLVEPFSRAVTAGQRPLFQIDIHFSPIGHALVAGEIESRYSERLSGP